MATDQATPSRETDTEMNSTSESEINSLSPPTFRPNYVLGFVGAVAGAALGYLAFYMLHQIGFYAMIVPGAMVGLGCGAQSGAHSQALGIFAAVVALGLSLFIEWQFFPFLEDDSLSFFLKHLGDLKPRTWLMLALSTFAGYWFGRGR